MPRRLPGGRFGKGQSGVQWYYDSLTPNLVALGPKLQVELKAALEFAAQDMESFMKTNAPWKDNSGQARDLLAARWFGTGLEQGIDLSHGVSYGIWLEVRWSGAYAIILPTIQAYNPMQAVSNILKSSVGAL